MACIVQVAATESLSPTRQWSIAQVIIDITDVNDNLPIFDQTQYTFSVLENAANGTKLGAVKVSNFSLVQRKIWSLCLFFINTNKIFLLFIDPKIRKTFAVLFKARWFTSISKVAIQSQKINFFLMIVRGRNKDCLY